MANCISIDFDRVQLVHACKQWHGDGAEAWPDLHHAIFWARIDCADDLGNHARIVQEVLPETFTSEVHVQKVVWFGRLASVRCRLAHGAGAGCAGVLSSGAQFDRELDGGDQAAEVGVTGARKR